MNHKVIVVRSHRYPFESRWKCVCGVLMESTVFGHPLNAEFNRHLRAVREAEEEKARRKLQKEINYMFNMGPKEMFG